MQIKKFLAPTLKEATEQMKRELGGEAIILGTRVIEGDRRFNAKKMFEITAGIDKAIKKSTSSSGERTREQAHNVYENEVANLTKKIFDTKTEIEQPKIRKSKNDSYDKVKYNNRFNEFADVLNEREIKKDIINSLVNQLENYDGLTEDANLESHLISAMASFIPTKEFKVKKNKTTKVALVGPTGVGKTTCIAKLAVISKIIHKLKVGLISIDTYRLGAIDQLRIFSEISDIEMAVAYEPEEMPKLIKKFKDKDIVFIDTVGRSQRSKENLNKIKSYLDQAEVDEISLVLNSTSSTRTLFDVAQKFKPLNYSSVIFSKADEAVAYGNILNLTNNFNVPVMFITNGQVIPDDIISVNSEFLANLIYTGKLY